MRVIRTQHQFTFRPAPKPRVPRLTHHKGVAVASTGWTTPQPKQPQGLIFALNLGRAFAQGVLNLDRFHSALKLDADLRNLAAQALPHTYGEIRNTLERVLK